MKLATAKWLAMQFAGIAYDSDGVRHGLGYVRCLCIYITIYARGTGRIKTVATFSLN